jgi:hypothetical protein
LLSGKQLSFSVSRKADLKPAHKAGFFYACILGWQLRLMACVQRLAQVIEK